MSVRIDIDIQPAWAAIRAVRSEVERGLADYPAEIRTAAAMTASELVENAVKYGESLPRAELTQIVRQVEYEKELGAGFVQMFTIPSWRRRTLLVMFLL